MTTTEPVKVCRKCGESKAISEYHRQGVGRFGVRSRCKPCSRRKRKPRRPLSAEHKAKIAAALKGHPVSQQARQKIAAAMQGNTHGVGHTVSQEARKRMGEAKKGNRYTAGLKRPPEWCRQNAERQKGNTHKLGKKDSPVTIARKRGAMLARRGRPVLPSPSPGIVGFVPDYRAERVVFFRP